MLDKFKEKHDLDELSESVLKSVTYNTKHLFFIPDSRKILKPMEFPKC